MATMRVVRAFDELEDRDVSLDLSAEAVPAESHSSLARKLSHITSSRYTLVLSPEPGKFLPLLAGQSSKPAARIAFRLRYPVANRLGRRLELLREFVGTTPSSHQLYHSASGFRRIPCMTLGHRGSPSFPHSATVHEIGSTPDDQ